MPLCDQRAWRAKRETSILHFDILASGEKTWEMAAALLLRENKPGVALLLVKKQIRTTTEGQEAANKGEYGSWEALLGEEESGWSSSPWNAHRAQLWGNAAVLFLSSYSKKGASGVSSDSSGKVLSSYKIGFGSFVLLCNFVIRNQLLALTE